MAEISTIENNQQDPPINDKFRGSIPITGDSGHVEGSNVGAGGPEAGEPEHRGKPAEHSVWYRWKSPSTDGIAVFTTFESSFNSRVAAYAERVDGNNFDILKAVEVLAKITRLDLVIFKTVADTFYRIAVDGNDSNSGEFTLQWGAAEKVEAMTAALPIYISGQVTNNIGQGLNGVELPAKSQLGDYIPATTEILGLYEHLLKGDRGWTIIPSLNGFYFDPTHRDHPPPRIGIFNQNYTGYSLPEFSFNGLIRDRVSPATIEPDSQMDGTFAVDFPNGSGNGQVIELTLTREGGGMWSTNQQTGAMILGVAPTLDDPLLNDRTGAVNFAVSDGSSVALFASDDPNNSFFTTGSRFTLTIKFSDGRMPEVEVTI